MDLQVILTIALILLVIIEFYSYAQYSAKVKIFDDAVDKFDKRAIEYETAFNDYAATVLLVTETQKDLAERQSEMIQHLTEIETLVSIHSEALNTKLLNDLVTSRLPILEQE